MNTDQKLDILTDSGKYDLACACKHFDEPGRERGDQGRWIYPAALPNGQKVFLLKTLQSNACSNDCSYCPFNASRDLPRCTLGPDEMAQTFMQLYHANRVSGLFLSSGIVGSAESSMERMLATVELLRRRYAFRGFVHLKVLPGASEEAIKQAVRLATRVSINIEAPNATSLARLSRRKRFYEDIVSAMRTIARLRRESRDHARRGVGQTTQFVVGAAGESDREIVTTTQRLYQAMDLERVYFSAFQDPAQRLPACQPQAAPLPPTRQGVLFDDAPVGRSRPGDHPSFIREHRLYQVDFLFRRYGFDLADIAFDPHGNLRLDTDPKTLWAQAHPELFPLDLNRAPRHELLRVPGIGPVSAARILKARKYAPLRDLDDLRTMGVRTNQCIGFVHFGPSRNRQAGLWP